MSDRTRKILLVASLALNLFFLAGIGVVLSKGANASRPAPLPVLRHAALSLNPQDRVRFLDLLRAKGRIARPSNLRARALRLEGWGSLADPAFDPATVKTKLAEARRLNQDARGAVEDAVIDFAATLTPAERAALGEGLRDTILQNNNLPTPPKK